MAVQKKVANAKRKVAQVSTSGGCCNSNVGNQVICLDIPGKANLVILGIPLEVQLKCLSIASKRKLTQKEIQMISSRLGALLSGLLGGLGG